MLCAAAFLNEAADRRRFAQNEDLQDETLLDETLHSPDSKKRSSAKETKLRTDRTKRPDQNASKTWRGRLTEMTDIVNELIESYDRRSRQQNAAEKRPCLKLRRFEEVADLGAAEFSDHDPFYVTIRDGFLFIFKAYVPHVVPESDTAFVDKYFYAYGQLYDAKRAVFEDVKRLVPDAANCEAGYKGLLLKLGFGKLLHNTLVWIKPFGTFFGVEIIDTAPHSREKEAPGATLRVSEECSADTAEDVSCMRCGKCSEACPSGTLTSSGFDRSRCLRQRQFGTAVLGDSSEKEMGNRLLGCNECQLACPLNAGILGKTARPDNDYYGLFDLDTLAESCCRGGFKKSVYAEILGYNYAKPVKVLGRTLSAMLNDDPVKHLEHVKKMMLTESEYAAPLLKRYIEICEDEK